MGIRALNILRLLEEVVLHHSWEAQLGFFLGLLVQVS
jgi:hypothetical protein